MQKNLAWIGFCLLVAVITLWFVGKAGYELTGYLRLSQTAPVKILNLQIKQLGRDRFVTKAHFSFEYKGQTVEGEGYVGRAYPNKWAAESSLEKLPTDNYHVWFNPRQPLKATLSKKFPLKSIISAAILLGITLYFLSLGFYVKMKN